MLIGHQRQWQFLKQAAESDKISHAYLFSGQEKLGKKTMAIEWISCLFGENLQGKLHPDFILIEPQNKEIQIDQIRDLIWKLSLKPYSAPLKTAVIDQAHLMNEEAQNCFLKTLEEPKGKTLLILITEYPEMLFPTILSRVQRIKFYPVKKIEIDNYLKNQKISKEEAEKIAELSLGRPGVAIDFVLQPKKLESWQQKTKELIKISNADLASRFQYAKDLSGELQGLKETLDIWLSYFRNVLIEEINSQSKKYSLDKLKNILKLIQKTNFLISTTNINPRLALEILMLEL